MSARAEAKQWLACLLFVAPLLLLLWGAEQTSGWLSTMLWITLFAAFTGLLAYGMHLEVRAWQDIEDQFDDRDPPPDA